jgi:hypothetical protein
MGIAVATRAHSIVLAPVVFVAGCCDWGVWAPVFALLCGITPAGLWGISFGLNSTINFIGWLVAPIATGWIKDGSGSFVGACYLAAAIGLAGHSRCSSSNLRSPGGASRPGFKICDCGFLIEFQSVIFNHQSPMVVKAVPCHSWARSMSS